MATRALGSLSRAGFFDLLAPGLYAWGVTVAGPVSQRFAPLGSRILALLAVVALASGALLSSASPGLARVAGIWVFVGASVGAWALAGSSLAPPQLDPAQGVLGSVGWLLFAIAWAAPRSTPPKASSLPARPVEVGRHALPPRSTMPRAMPLVLGLVAAAAAVPMVLAWWVESLERALFAHAIALAAALALLAYAGDIFDPGRRGGTTNEPPGPSPAARLWLAAPPLAALLALVLLGASYLLLR